MDDLVGKLMSSFDPARRGLCRWTLAAGIRPRLRIASPEGLYLLRRGTNRGTIDQVVGAAGPAATSVREFAWTSRTPETAYFYQVVPVGPGGAEAIVPASGAQLVRVATADDHRSEEPTPAAPTNLAAIAVAGGRVRVVWMPGTAARRPAAATYAIFSNGGAGDVDWTTAVDTVTARGLRQHGWLSDPYADATELLFGVRARASGGEEEANVVTVSVIADAAGPAAVVAQAALVGADE